MWVYRVVGTLICISEGAKGSIDEAFSTAICLTCVCFWTLLTKCEGPGPPWPTLLPTPMVCVCTCVCVCVCVCVRVCVCVCVCFVHVCAHQ